MRPRPGHLRPLGGAPVLARPERLGVRARGATILSPWGDGERSGIVTSRPDPDPVPLSRALGEAKIITRIRNGGIRLSPHCYANDEDRERLLAVIDAQQA